MPIKFDTVGRIDKTSVDIAGKIDRYIINKYDRECASGCFVPIKITSYYNGQTINIDKLSV